MSRSQRIIGALIRPMVKRRARRRSVADVVERLEDSRAVVESRAAGAPDTAGNREALHHIVGIERWGQSRLKALLGAPLELDSYQPYRLPEGSDISALRVAFRETRTGTLRLARELAEAGVEPGRTVRHNDIGDLTAVEWLVYLDDHAKRESLRFRGKATRPR